MQKLFKKIPLARWQAAGWSGAAGLLEALSLTGLLVFLLAKTWLRWPEPLIDFPRQLYIPWRMSEGALLYQDVVSNYGPLPHLVEAEAFRIFGPGLDVIVWLNIGIVVMVLLLLRGIFGMLGDRLSAWLCAVVFLVVFAMPLYGDSVRSLFNFITPYSSEATYGLVGCLITVFSLLRHAGGGRPRWLFAAGCGLAVALLCKLEILLAAGGALTMYLAIIGMKIWKEKRTDEDGLSKLARFARLIGWTTAGFLAVYIPVWLILSKAGGWTYGFNATNWTLRVFFDPAYAQVVSTSYQDVMMGFDHPEGNLLKHLGWGVLLLVFCAAVGWAARQWQQGLSEGRAGQGALIFVLAASFLVVLLVDWLEIGRALLVPTALAALISVGGAFRRAWRGEAGHERLLKLAVVATAAMLLLTRMLLNVRIYNYGFFLSVLAALLLVHVLVYEAPVRFGQPERPNSLLQIIFILLVLTGTAYLGRQSLANYANRTYVVGSGRDKFYTCRPNVSGEGAILNIITAAMQKYLGNAKTVVAFPESMAVNYDLRKVNPIAEMQFVPDALDLAGRANVLAELAAHPPEVVVVYARELSEYQVAHFGADENSGKSILDWVKTNYKPAYNYGQTTYSDSGHVIDIYVRRDLAARH